MKNIHLLYSDDMARAVVQGRKTVTRRPVLPQPTFAQVHEWKGRTVRDCESRSWCWRAFDFCDAQADCHGRDDVSAAIMRTGVAPCAPGDLMIGRECWASLAQDPEKPYDDTLPGGVHLEYRADHGPPKRKPGGWEDAESGDPDMVHWRPSIHMPLWAARIRRTVVAVSVERLQDVTEEDAVREGVARNPVKEGTWIDYPEGGSAAGWATARESFRTLWESIYAARGLGWALSPWVWRIEFGAKNALSVGGAPDE